MNEFIFHLTKNRKYVFLFRYAHIKLCAEVGGSGHALVSNRVRKFEEGDSSRGQHIQAYK